MEEKPPRKALEVPKGIVQTGKYALPPNPLLILIYSFSISDSYLLVCKNWAIVFKSSMGAKLLYLPLAHNFRTGTGGFEQNRPKALHFYQQAALQGNDEAEAWIAFCYLEALGGVPSNDAEAFRLSKVGVEKKIPFAYRNLGYCYEHGKGIQKETLKSFEYYRQGMELGNSFAFNSVAGCYEDGTGVNKDLKEAIRLYQIAVKLGNPFAQYNLGRCYQSGIGVAHNLKEAAILFKLCAEQGDSSGQVHLAYCYEEGLGVEKNVEEALRLYMLSAEQGDSEAQYCIGFRYEQGLLGFKKDKKKALVWYEKSVAQGNKRAALKQKNLNLSDL